MKDLELIKKLEENVSESELISGIVETTEVANRIHVVATIDSVLLNILIDNGFSRVLVRASLIIECSLFLDAPVDYQDLPIVCYTFSRPNVIREFLPTQVQFSEQSCRSGSL